MKGINVLTFVSLEDSLLLSLAQVLWTAQKNKSPWRSLLPFCPRSDFFMPEASNGADSIGLRIKKPLNQPKIQLCVIGVILKNRLHVGASLNAFGFVRVD